MTINSIFSGFVKNFYKNGRKIKILLKQRVVTNKSITGAFGHRKKRIHKGLLKMK